MTDVPAPSRASTRRVGQFAIAATVFLLGFLLAVQLRTQEGLTDRLAIERESDLGQILTELTGRSDRLLEEIVDLRVKVAQTSGSAAQERALLEGAREQLESLRIMLGIVPVRGPGVEITISDPEGTVGPDLLLDAIQELRDAGAEAIEINRIRVVASTSVGGRPGAVRLGSTPIAEPFIVRAIGSASTLAEAMRIPSGVVDALGARAGTSVRITEQGSVSILSTTTIRQFQIGRPSRRR